MYPRVRLVQGHLGRRHLAALRLLVHHADRRAWDARPPPLRFWHVPRRAPRRKPSLVSVDWHDAQSVEVLVAASGRLRLLAKLTASFLIRLDAAASSPCGPSVSICQLVTGMVFEHIM